MLGYLLCKIKDIARDLGLENGYRVVTNNGEDAFQTVKHLHFHVNGKQQRAAAVPEAGTISTKKKNLGKMKKTAPLLWNCGNIDV